MAAAGELSMLSAPTPAHPPLDSHLAEAAERLALDLLPGLASQRGWTPFHTAALSGHSEVVDRLIAARAMVDAADKVPPSLSSRPHLPRAFTSDAANRQHHVYTIKTCFDAPVIDLAKSIIRTIFRKMWMQHIK
jgi:hypothetical protein